MPAARAVAIAGARGVACVGALVLGPLTGIVFGGAGGVVGVAATLAVAAPVLLLGGFWLADAALGAPRPPRAAAWAVAAAGTVLLLLGAVGLRAAAVVVPGPGVPWGEAGFLIPVIVAYLAAAGVTGVAAGVGMLGALRWPRAAPAPD